MPDLWADWDERVKRTGFPTRVVEDLTDLEILNLLADGSPRRATEKQLLRQECYRRMGHPDAPPARQALGEPRRGAYRPEDFSQLPSQRDYEDPR